MKPRVVAVALTAILGTISFAPAALAGGDLDGTFDSDGKVITAYQPNFSAVSMAIQGDGKIVAVGNVTAEVGTDFAVVRYNSDGSLDATFDGDGKVTTNIGGWNSGWTSEYTKDLAIQSDGKIVVVGIHMSRSNNYDFAVVRYNTDGSLDTSFDTDGKVTTNIGTSTSADYVESVAIQSDGKIVVIGSAYITGRDFAAVRYNTDGSLDTSFDTDGKVTTSIKSTDSDLAEDVAIQSDGKIVVAGHVGTNREFALIRYNTDGSLDTSFDTDGKVTTNIGNSGNDFAYSVAIQNNGKIVVAGFGNPVVYSDIAVVRYNSDGSLDTTFDTDGIATTNISGNSSGNAAYSVAIQSDGKIVVAGYAHNGSNYDFGIVRYNTDGSLDTTFDTDGKVITNIGGDDYAYSVAIQSDGKIVVAGNSSDNGLVIVRYEGTSLEILAFNSLALGGTAMFRQVVTITANMSVPSRVSFMSNGKRIAGCKNRSTSGSTPNILVTCTWRPSVRGSVIITATATTTGSGRSDAASIPLAVLVSNRTGVR